MRAATRAKRGFKHRVDVLSQVDMRPYARLGSNFYARLREIETLQRRDGGQRSVGLPPARWWSRAVSR